MHQAFASIRSSRQPLLHCFGALLFAMLPALAAAENLIVNGTFDSDLSGWQNLGAGLVEWSPLDFPVDGDSGSALLGNNAAAAGTRLTVLRQCLQVATPSHAYRLGAAGLHPSGQGGGRLLFSYGFRSTPDCSGGAFVLGGLFFAVTDVWNVQQAFVIRDRPVPAGSSIEFLVSIEKDAAGGLFLGHVDAVHVTVDGLLLARFEPPETADPH
jgi:hypothetical protein